MNGTRTPFWLRMGTSATLGYGVSTDLTPGRNSTGKDLVITSLGWVVNDQYADFKLIVATSTLSSFSSAAFSLITATTNFAQGYGGTFELPAPIFLGPNMSLEVNAENFNNDKSTSSFLELTWGGYLVSDS